MSLSVLQNLEQALECLGEESGFSGASRDAREQRKFSITEAAVRKNFELMGRFVPLEFFQNFSTGPVDIRDLYLLVVFVYNIII